VLFLISFSNADVAFFARGPSLLRQRPVMGKSISTFNSTIGFEYVSRIHSVVGTDDLTFS